MSENDARESVTAILQALDGEIEPNGSLARAVPLVYDALRSLAEAYLRGERRGHTLQATGLVHEAYVRLAEGEDMVFNDQAHFFRLAAMTMRRILIDHARRRATDKRGGGSPGFTLSETALLFDDRNVEILEVDDALERLFTLSPDRARVVEMRYYGGCTIDETARALGISTATVERHWRFARAWLRTQFSNEDEPAQDE